MKDLNELNRRIASFALGSKLTPEQEAYIEFLPVCLGRLTASVGDIKRLVFGVKREENGLPIVYINRDYLNFARLACKDVAAGHFERLVELGISLGLAEVIASLSNDQVTRLASCWPGAIVEFDARALAKGLELHASAARYHASAYLAASH